MVHLCPTGSDCTHWCLSWATSTPLPWISHILISTQSRSHSLANLSSVGRHLNPSPSIHVGSEFPVLIGVDLNRFFTRWSEPRIPRNSTGSSIEPTFAVLEEAR